jgi:hypothetical protein
LKSLREEISIKIYPIKFPKMNVHWKSALFNYVKSMCNSNTTEVSVFNGDHLSMFTCPNKFLEIDVQYKSNQSQYGHYPAGSITEALFHINPAEAVTGDQC